MNSYWILWVAHAWAQKITVRQHHCRSVTYLTVILSYQDLGCRRTETMHHQRMGRSESHGYWQCCCRVASASTRAFVLEADSWSTRWNKDCVM